MNTPQSDGRVLPVVIRDENGVLLGAGISNEKGYRKSIERGEAWLLDGLSGRLLPAENLRGFKGIAEKEGYLEITADGWEARDAGAEEAPGAAAEQGSRKEDTRAGSPQPAVGARQAAVDLAADSGGTVPGFGGAGAADASILSDLQELIYRRKAEMPEGSYTTHLFEKGEEKIRKKTGEEAVELILAGSNAELASEAADLLYHMMVLFAQRGISISDALAVLAERHAQ